MKIADLNGKTVCVLGYGREGKAMLKALEAHAPEATITVADENIDEVCTTCYQYKKGFDELDGYDVLITSPGIPPHKLSTINHQLTNSTQIFLDSIADNGATVIGVTGSKGKSTTASLIAAILKAANKDALLLGNIGEPAIAHIDDVKKDMYVAMEMSSYQLMHLTRSPHIAVVTSFFPEHLDYHGSLDAYRDAKKHITQFQSEDDMVFFNANNPGAAEIAKEGDGRKIPVHAEDAPVTVEETKLLGAHNLSNIALAAAVAHELGVSDATIVSAIKNFEGLPHRLQMVGTFAGIDWVDDAISTTPESTIAGIHALGGRVKTIILGGHDRGNDFTELAATLVKESIEHAILFPGSGARIRSAIEDADTQKRITLHDAADMKTAVELAKDGTPEGTVCLLSTASPSYGLFKNFEEKGEKFQDAVKRLP